MGKRYKKPSELGLFKLGAVHLVLLFGALLTLVPMVYMVCSSIKSQSDFFTSKFLPLGDGFLGVAWDRLTLSHYLRLFTELDFVQFILNSFVYAAIASVLATLFCSMGGFALAKYRFRGRRLMTVFIFFTLMIPAPLLLAPSYQWLFQLGLLDTYTGLILPGAATAFGVFLFRQSMLNTIPDELLEAARMDGCNEVELFFYVVIPLVRPTLAAFLLITFLMAWNNFILPQIILQSPEKQTLAVAIAQMKGLYSQDYGMLMAGTFVSILPVVILFLFLQKEFISGLTSGAVKG
jgi:ABC-type glycerol-3-phosphate transport system permease component